MYLQDLVDKKHADCNGDGIVSTLDLTAINQNYGNLLPGYPHNDAIQMMPVTPADPVLQVLTPAVYDGPFTVSLPIDLSAPDSVRNVYGLAARVHYDPAMIVPGSVTVNFTNGWLGTYGIDMIGLVKDFYSDGYVEFGMVRADNNKASGNGIVAYLNFTLSQASGLINLDIDPVVRLISNGISNQEVFLPISKINSQFNFLNVSVDEIGHNGVMLFPNPATDVICLQTNDHSSIEKIILCDMNGRIITEQNFDGSSSSGFVDCSHFPPGIYMATIVSGTKSLMRRITVLRN
jgi:hypothetical protein